VYLMIFDSFRFSYMCDVYIMRFL